MKQCSKYCVKQGEIYCCDLLFRNNKEKDYPCVWKRETTMLTDEHTQQGEFWEIEQRDLI